MAITKKFNGSNAYIPGYWGLPYSEDEIAHNNLIAVFERLGVFKYDAALRKGPSIDISTTYTASSSTIIVEAGNGPTANLHSIDLSDTYTDSDIILSISDENNK